MVRHHQRAHAEQQVRTKILVFEFDDKYGCHTHEWDYGIAILNSLNGWSKRV